MSQADSVDITVASKRQFLLMSGRAAVVFGTLSAAATAALPKALEASDPVLLALEKYRAARDAFRAVQASSDDDVVDTAADRLANAREEALTARPTKRKGAEWLAMFAANQAEKLGDPDAHDIARAIDTLAAFMFVPGAEG